MPILTGVRSGSFGNLRSAILASPSAPDDNILLDDDAKRPARTDAKRRLDIEIAGYKLITRSSSALLRGFADGANKIALALAPYELGTNAEQGREGDTLKKIHRVVVARGGTTRQALRVSGEWRSGGG